jgi:hypothetical protein
MVGYMTHEKIPSRTRGALAIQDLFTNILLCSVTRPSLTIWLLWLSTTYRALLQSTRQSGSSTKLEQHDLNDSTRYSSTPFRIQEDDTAIHNSPLVLRHDLAHCPLSIFESCHSFCKSHRVWNIFNSKRVYRKTAHITSP